MIFRFCLYGFLKNQRFFEPFFLLAMLDRGLTFMEFGLLIGTQSLVQSTLEIPSGLFADAMGRRRSLVISMLGYIAAFAIFGLSNTFTPLLGAAALMGLGDSFRSGTHKAMIFRWLELNGRQGERTRIYGKTRSWSKLGSALSALVAAGIVLATQSFTAIFFFSMVPYVVLIASIATYPRELDNEPPQSKEHETGTVERRSSFITLFLAHLSEVFASLKSKRELRTLLVESVAFDSIFTAAKDYIQPAIGVIALAAGASLFKDQQLSTIQQQCLFVGIVYAGLNLLASQASRHAHRLDTGGDGAKRLCGLGVVIYALIAAGALMDAPIVVVGAFVASYAAQNAWRPILMGRLDKVTDTSSGATLLSVEHQARGLAAMIGAPLIGFLVDTASDAGSVTAYWPIGAVGVAVTLIITLALRTK
jgi:MFS family permease